MILPQRVANHRTETQAVRCIINEISVDWLIRGMEERDYGVDLMFELFNERFPTGRIAFIQSKGTQDEICPNNDGDIVLSGFPSKTVAYSLRLSEPFFVFYTSVTTKTTYFVWLQMYAKTKLSQTNPDWRTQDSVTLYLPNTNLLTNHIKIESILLAQQLTDQTIEVLRNTRWLRKHLPNIFNGESACAESALQNVRAISSCNAVLTQLIDTEDSLDVAELSLALEEIHMYQRITDGNAKTLQDAIIAIDCLEGDILDQSDFDMFEADMTGAPPPY